MELELGLKITKTKDDIASISEYQLAKDRTGPVFRSSETNTMFILTAHLKGYKRNNIDIKISEDGSKISISGEKPIQEMLMMGWVMFKKDVEIARFNKVFKIPDGVILDRIKAKYDEEEWTLKIVMPKSVKGICGARIEEVKEEYSDADHILNRVRETSENGSRNSEAQEMKDGESVMEKKKERLSEKMLDDANVDRIRDKIRTEVEESNLGVKDGNGTSVSEKVGKVEYEAIETSNLEQNAGASISDKVSEIQEIEDSEGFVEKKEGRVADKMPNNADGEIIGETIQKGTEDRKGVSAREKGGNATYEAVKRSEIEQKVGTGILRNIEDNSHDEESEVQEMDDSGTYASNAEKEKTVSNKMLDTADGNKIGETIEKEIEESKLGIEGGDGESEREKDRKVRFEAVKTLEVEQNASQESSEESEVQQVQEAESAIEKVETEDRHKESVEEVVSVERFEETKASELDGDVADRIPINVGGIEQEESEECGTQDMEKTESVEGNMDGRESERMHIEANKEIKKPKIETNDGDEERGRETAAKEGFEAITTAREEFPEYLPKPPQEISKGMSVPKMKESKEVTEAMVKRKGKKIECSVEEGEGEEPKGMHVEAKALTEKDIAEETRQEKIEKPKGGIKDSDQKNVHGNITEELLKQVEEKLSDGSKGFVDAEVEEPKGVIEVPMAEAESSMEKVEGEASKKRTEKASKVIIEKSTLSDPSQKEDEKLNIEKKAKDGSDVPNIVVEGVFDVMGTVQVKVPKKVVEAMALDENDKTEYGIVKLKGEGSIRMNLEANKVLDEETTRDRKEKEIRESKLKSRDQLRVQENIDDNRGLDGSKRPEFSEAGEIGDAKEEGEKIKQSINGKKYEEIQAEANGSFRKNITRETTQRDINDPKIQTKEGDQCLQDEMASKSEFPMKMVDSLAKKRAGLKDTRTEEAREVEEELVKQKSEEKEREIEDIKERGEEIEQSAKVEGEKYEEIQVETNGGIRKDITKETTPKETDVTEVQTKEKDQRCLQEEASKGRLEARKAAQEEFPAKTIDSVANEREGLKGTTPEKAKEEKELLFKQQSEEKKETEDAKEKGTEIEQFVKNEKRDKFEKIQFEANEDLKKDITRQATQKETKDPKFQTEENYQQCLQEEISKGRFEASTTAEEFPLNQKKDSLAKRRDEQEDENIEAEKIKEEVDIESTAKEKIQEPEIERITETLKDVPEEKHTKALEMGTDEREQKSKKSPMTFTVVGEGFKDVEQGSARKQKTELLSPKNQRKETLESRDESVSQDIEKSEKTKQKEKGEQRTHNIESTKAVATIEDQVAKPRFPSTQQFEDEEGVCNEKYESTPESQKDDRTKDLQNSVEIKDQESKQKETLKPEVSPEELRKKSEQETGKNELQKEQKVEETMQQEIKQDQQHVQRNVGKEGYASDEGSIGGRTETKRGLEATLVREKYITQNVNDEKLREKEGIKKTGIEKMDKVKCTAELTKTTQVKEHQRQPEAAEKEAEPLEATSSLPSLTSMGVKSVRPELHQKDLSPLTLTAGTKSKEPLKLEEPIMEWKLPKTKEYVPESSDMEQCGYGTKDVRGYEQEVALGECGNQERNKEEIKGQQYVDEELLSRQHRAEEIVEKREVPKISKRGEIREASKQLHGGEKGKTTQIAEDTKPETKEVTSETEKASGFKQVAERMQEPPTMVEISPRKGIEKSHREEMSPLPTDIQRKEHCEVSWPSMASQQCQVKERDKTKASDEVGNQESKREHSKTNVQDSNKGETDQEVEQVQTPQPESRKHQLCINKDEEESQGRDQAEGEKANELQEDEEYEVVVVEKQKECEDEEEASGGNKDDKKRRKKLIVPLFIAGSSFLVSLVFIYVHRRRSRKRSN